jgi:hypothetical protein
MEMDMTRLVITAALVAALGVGLSILGAQSNQPVSANWSNDQPQPIQSANVHALVGASFRSVHASL